MKFININIIVEGGTEENFVNDVLVNHFATINKFVYARKITTGWDRLNKKPAKGGLLKYSKFRNDVLRWIKSDKNKEYTFYTSLIDLYAFPKDSESPYTKVIQSIHDHYERIASLESAIAQDINNSCFIPYVQLHEFEAFLLVDPDRLISMYPDEQTGIEKLKKDIGNANPEEINESSQTAPSKRIIKYLPNYKEQKAQVGPLVAKDIGINTLRKKCPHFNGWINKLESL